MGDFKNRGKVTGDGFKNRGAVLAGGSFTNRGAQDADNREFKNRGQAWFGGAFKNRGQTLLESNLVTNGTFDTDTWWTKAGLAVISGGKGTITDPAGGANGFSRDNFYTVGLSYSVTLDVVIRAGGLKISDNLGSNYQTITTTGTHTATFTALGTTISLYRASPGQAIDLDIDNVVVRRA